MTEGATDEELVRLCLHGQPDMFGHIVCRYERSVINFLVSRLGDGNDASEAAQEVMVRAYFALPKLRNATALSSWIMGIADRVAKETIRRRRSIAQLVVDGVAREIAARPNRIPGSGPELQKAVDALPELHGQVIRMRFFEGQSCAQIGRRLGITLGTVTSRLSRSYALLRHAVPELDPNSEVNA